MIETLFVDWDGMIVKSSDAVIDTYRQVTAHVLGVRRPATPGEEALALNAPAADVLEMWSAASTDLDDLVSAFELAYGGWATGAVALRDGAAEFLSRLALVGPQIITISSKSDHMMGVDRLMLGLMEPAFRVEGNIDAWGLGRQPRDLQTLCTDHDLSPRTAAFLCDNPRDVIEARVAGIRTVVVLTGEVGDERLLAESPDHVLHDLSQVFDLLLHV